MLRKIFLLIIILTVLLFCSCQSSTVTEKEGSTTPVFSVFHYQDEVPNYLTADLDVQVPQSDFLCPLYQTKMFHMSYEEFEEIKEFVLQDDTITREINQEEENYTLYETDTSAGEVLVYEVGVYASGVFYIAKEYNDVAPIRNIFTDDSINQWWSEEDLAGVDSDLNCASRQEVIDELTEFLARLNIFVVEPAEIYSFDQKSLSILSQKYNAASDEEFHMREEWSEKDECYVVLFKEKINSLPILSAFTNSYIENNIAPTTIEFVYQNGRIIKLSIDNPYSSSEVYDQVSLLPFESIKESLHKKYESLIWDGSPEKEIESVELVYYADYKDDTKEAICLRPVWVFEVKNSVEGVEGISGSYSTHIMFDAETGKEVSGT